MNNDNIDDLLKAYAQQINYLATMNNTIKLKDSADSISDIDILKAKLKSINNDLNGVRAESVNYYSTLASVLNKMFISIGWAAQHANTMKKSILDLSKRGKHLEVATIIDETICFYIFKIAELNGELNHKVEELQTQLDSAYEEIDELKGE